MSTVKRVGENKHPVLRLPYPEVPGAYFILSFKQKKISAAHMSYYIKYQEPFYPDEAFVTFFYGGDDQGAEWEPQYGPIMTYRKCSPDWKGEGLGGGALTAKEHWFYDYVEDNALAWSQLAVNREGLKPMLAKGDYDGIFRALKRWAESD